MTIQKKITSLLICGAILISLASCDSKSKKALSVVRNFLHLTNEAKDIKGAVRLMADDIQFVGPATKISGSKEYAALLEKFLPMHIGWKMHKEFQNGDEICVIDDIFVRTPAQGKITLSLVEWFKVSEDKIVEHRVYYDPREFVKAFGL